MRRIDVHIVTLLVVVVLNFNPARAQIFKDDVSVRLLKDCAGYIYNFQFHEADSLFSVFSRANQGHPAVLLLRGMITYWKDFPVTAASASRESFEKTMRDCIMRSDSLYPGFEAEYLLTNLCSRGFLLEFYADNNIHKEVMPLAKSTYKYLRRSFGFTSVNVDFCFFTGLYDYYREAYPEAHPIYKAIAFIFPKGDKKKGLSDLEKASREGVLMKAEATSFLVYISQEFENNLPRATFYSRTLHEMYPLNLHFYNLYIRSLLQEGKYDEAEKQLADRCWQNCNSYFRACHTFFNGILQEKKYHNYNLSEKWYLQAIEEIGKYGEFGNDFASYGYYGLSRLRGIKKDDRGEKDFRKKANSLSDTKDDIFGK